MVKDTAQSDWKRPFCSIWLIFGTEPDLDPPIKSPYGADPVRPLLDPPQGVRSPPEAQGGQNLDDAVFLRTKADCLGLT